MKKIAESVLAAVKKDQAAIRNSMCMKSGDVEIYPASVHKLGDAAVMMGRDSEKRFLLVVADSAKALPAGFAGDQIALADGGVALVRPQEPPQRENHRGLRRPSRSGHSRPSGRGGEIPGLPGHRPAVHA